MPVPNGQNFESFVSFEFCTNILPQIRLSLFSRGPQLVQEASLFQARTGRQSASTTGFWVRYMLVLTACLFLSSIAWLAQTRASTSCGPTQPQQYSMQIVNEEGPIRCSVTSLIFEFCAAVDLKIKRNIWIISRYHFFGFPEFEKQVYSKQIYIPFLNLLL